MLDGLGVGASEADVVTALGEPDDTSAIKPPIWKYGQSEVTFRDGRVVMLAVYEQLSADGVKQLLRKAGVEYRPDPELSYDTQEAYVVAESKVSLTLDTTGRARAIAT